MDEENSTPAGRRTVDAALARVEAKLDVAIAQHGARLDEHTREIIELKAGHRRHDERISAVETAQAVNDAKDARDDQARTVGLTRSQAVALWITVAVMLTVGIATVIVTLVAHR